MPQRRKARRAIGNPSPRYTAEFKQKAVEPYRKSGTTYAGVARELGCDPGSLSDWAKRADAAGPAPDANPFQMAEDLRRLKRENAAQARERDALKSERPLRQQAAVGASAKRAKFESAFLNEGGWPVSEMCAALKVTRRGYHAWRSRPPSAHAMRDAELAEPISRVRERVRNIYGAPKTFMRLQALGVRASRKRVARIMRGRGWRGVTRACAKRPLGENRASKRESAMDLVGRRFEADDPNMARFADIAYVKTRQGWLCLALVMDIWSRRIVGRSMGPSITAELANEALKMALARRNPPEGCVHHSDHGSQCVSLLLPRTMRENGIRPSMGSISSPWDNAAMESLMGIVKSECVHARTYATRKEAALDLFECIEVVYNRARIHSALGYLSPAEFEEANWPKENSRSRAA